MSDKAPNRAGGDDCATLSANDWSGAIAKEKDFTGASFAAPHPHFGPEEILSAIAPSGLADRLLADFQARPTSPLRQRIPLPDGRELMVMPAVLGNFAGVKALTVVPDNAVSARPVISGLFTLFDFSTGAPIATFDCSALTAVRTAAISAAASKRLSRANSRHLCVLGAGHLAPYLAAAHADVRPVRRATFWARRTDQADGAADLLRKLRPELEVVIEESIDRAVRSADIVTAATRATEPLISGEWLQPGQHLDLVGSYRPDMREIDEVGISRSEVFVDNITAASSEAGDIMVALRTSAIQPDKILGEFADIAAGSVGRSSDYAITLFKSVGTAVADLAAAIAIWENRRNATARD